MNIAIATSLFAESKFDPFLTISYAEENEICAVQFYMSQNIQENAKTIKKIRDLCEKKSIKVLCHSPFYIGNAAQKEHCEALFNIFTKRDDKYCVFHFDEDNDIDVMLDDCKKLVDFGLSPCIENFYKDKSQSGLFANIEKYLSFFDRIIAQNIPVIPVLDFPRLFIEEFADFSPVSLSQQLIQKFAEQKIIIHAIDSVSPRQDRQNWCAIGKGIVAYLDIFEAIKRLEVSVEYAVLEYENTLFIEESIRNLSRFVGE
jgi:sugar phosphate isomerase/epimerase